jgi:hypothetical protein
MPKLRLRGAVSNPAVPYAFVASASLSTETILLAGLHSKAHEIAVASELWFGIQLNINSSDFLLLMYVI